MQASISGRSNQAPSLSPIFFSASGASFITTVGGSFTISDAAFPAAALSETGTLPAGVTFVDNGNDTATITVDPSVPVGTTTLTLTAANGVLPNATQSFLLTVLAVPTFTVTNLNDAGTGSLRDAITAADTANSMAVINFADGLTGVLKLSSLLPDLTGNVIVVGPGANLLTIDARQTTAIIFQIPLGSTATISGLTLTNALAGNEAVNNSGVATIFNCVISGNFGDGIHNNGTLTLTGATVSGNQLGVSNDAGAETIVGSTISGNFASGVENSDSGTLTIIGSTISGNTGNSGGGIQANAGHLTVVNSTIAGNSADNNGGGIDAAFGSYLTVIDSTISGNSAAAGGGVYQGSGYTVYLNGTIVAANSGGDLGVESGFLLSGSHDLIGDGSDGGMLASSQSGTTLSPLNPHLSPLGFFGGPTQTMALLQGSPAFGNGADFPIQDTGGNDITSTDQRGITRPQSNSFDIGAFQSGVNIAPTINSSASASFFASIGGTFTIDAAGFPAVAVTETGTLPSGVTFVDNGNGTAALTVSASAAPGVLHLTLKAANGILPNATQSFTLTISQIPTFTVTNLSDSGAGSLRRAITDAETAAGSLDVIAFANGLTGRINLASNLPLSGGHP